MKGDALPRPADHRTDSLRLEPEANVNIVDGNRVALSREPWLRIASTGALARRRWVRLRYSSSYFDDPVRPMIRFDTAQGRQFLQFMNGPVLGSGEWIGRIPETTTAISISPVNRPGIFDFRMDSIRSVARRDLVRRGFGYDRGALMQSLGAKIINAKEERWETLKFAASATPLEDYNEWYRRLYRPIDIKGLDHLRSERRSMPVVRLIMSLDNGGVQALKATISSLRRQVYKSWSLHAVSSKLTPHDLIAAFQEEMTQDRRLAESFGAVGFLTLGPDFAQHDVIAVIGLGDLLPDYTLAVLADTIAQEPNIRIAYGDEDLVTATGKLHSPLFKPSWSPILFEERPYLGRLTCIRVDHLIDLGLQNAEELVCNEETVLKSAVKSASANDIYHVRRILYRRQREVSEQSNNRRVSVATSSPVTAVGDENAPDVSIIIPTRDRADLLTQCLKSLKELTDYPRYHLVIVDNGSKKSDALAQLQELRTLPHHQVLQHPGPFNFSKLCNAGALAAHTPILVFLNNDVVIIHRQWLSTLIRWAVRPDVGVVGVKLLFANKTIEHAGVVLGHGGIAGHIYHRQPAAQRGYMDQLMVTHEVEAVTGACIAIERAKFEAIGGFDEDLPVEFNDIDLCLRAAERGWTTIWTPESVLYHLQSASCGYPLKPSKVFRTERDYFLKRWAHVIRDDRYFHPALSLFSHKPALA